jgi:hypothetical protein
MTTTPNAAWLAQAAYGRRTDRQPSEEPRRPWFDLDDAERAVWLAAATAAVPPSPDTSAAPERDWALAIEATISAATQEG